MKIAFDGKRFFNNSSGLGNYSRDLVRVLATHFPAHEYLLLNKSKTAKGESILSLTNVDFIPTSKGNLSRQLKMGKDAQNEDADVFHGLSGELPLKWNPKPIRKVVTIHDLIFLKFPKYYSFFDRKIHLWKFRQAAKQADRIIAISEQTKRDIIHYLKVPEHKINVVYQGCHAAFKSKKTDEERSVVKLKYSLPERFILNVGTIEERKNLLNVVKAITDSEIPLVVVGKKTKYFGRVQKYLIKNKMQQRVHFIEGVSMDELAAIYQLADIFVYPSVYDGFGIPVIEALFSGTAVITSNRTSLPEAGGPDSLYVDPYNVADLKAKVLFLWENKSERDRRTEKGLRYVTKFEDEKVAADLMGVYESLFNTQE